MKKAAGLSKADDSCLIVIDVPVYLKSSFWLWSRRLLETLQVMESLSRFTESVQSLLNNETFNIPDTQLNRELHTERY